MAAPAKPTLLPAGLRDRLPAEAAAATRVMRAMVDAMAAHGYDRVQPALAEYLDTLANGDGADAARQLMRVTDPSSRQTLAIRSDMTGQVARIAATAMADAPRPLRLCYAGQVLRLAGPDLAPARERLQIGAELIGADSVAAAQEIVGVALDAVAAAGLGRPTLDFTMPDVVDVLAAGPCPLPADIAEQVRAELDAKDAGALAALGPAGSAYLPLIAAAGPFAEAVAALRRFDAAGVLSTRLAALEAIAEVAEGRATLTLDPTERHGFAFHSWLGFTLFLPTAAGVGMALGRGGTYGVPRGGGRAEPATGFSLYPDAWIGADGGPASSRRLLLPLGHDRAAAATARAEGWVTIAALDADQASATSAHGCGHRLDGDRIVPLG